MIVPMKKISIFVKTADKTNALMTLRELGVLHINEKSGKSEKLDSLITQKDELVKIIDRVELTFNSAVKNVTHRVEEKIRYNEVMQKRVVVLSIIDEEESIKMQNINLQMEIDRISEWGDFNPKIIQKLQSDYGLSIKLYSLAKKSLSKIDEKTQYLILKDQGKQVKIAVIGGILPENDEFISFGLPEYGIIDCQRVIDENLARKEEITATFYDEIRYLSAYKEVLKLINEEIIFETVKHSMDSNGTVSWITGFIPEESSDAVRSRAKSDNWGLLIDDVTEEDPVPTKLKNNKFVRIIQPVFDILGTVPGYREYDVSMFFLLFFAIFFAMIVGDAGYGLIFLGGAIGLHVGIKKLTEPVKLLYVLSSVTIIWGTLTGTWFGSSSLLETIPLLKGLVIPQISTFTELFEGVSVKDSQNSVIFISFLLGICQLSLACIINFFRQFPERKAFAQLGWLLMIVGLYFLVLTLVLSYAFPSWGMYLIVIGFITFVLFYEQKEGQSFAKGLLKGLGGLFNTFLDAISGFSNIISYIRLFAVGMASVAISSSFNSMAEPMFGGWTIPAAIIILLLGHGLNLVMGLLSVVVHGVRLNMLEFSGQLGMEWTGIKYEPFKENLEASIREYSQNSNNIKE